MIGKKVLFQNFELKSIEIKSAVTVEFTEILDVDGMDVYVNHKIECPMDPHQHLSDIFKAAKIHLIRSYGFETLLLALQKKHKVEISGAIKGMEALVTVSKIHFKGKEDAKSIMITGKCDSVGKKAVAMNSPLIFLNTSTYGYEQDLEEMCANLKEQVYAYLYEGKFTNTFDSKELSSIKAEVDGSLVS